MRGRPPLKRQYPAENAEQCRRVPILGGSRLKNGRQAVHNVHKNSTKISSFWCAQMRNFAKPQNELLDDLNIMQIKYWSHSPRRNHR
jgi:hypothetical protein